MNNIMNWYKAARGKNAGKKKQCWKGYKQVGMKSKGGRMVPNCVPKG